MNLASIDLNLFVALEALLAERSVTRAAQCIGITQPAMSNALRRLRHVLADPIMVRTSQGMVPTPRAEALAGDLREGMAALRRAVEPRSFDPATAERTFTIVCTDYDELVALPPLVAYLAEHAPGVTIHVRKYAVGYPASDLLTGDADLFLGVWPSPPAPLRAERLFVETMCCLVRRDHPRVQRRLTKKQFVDIPHVLCTPLGMSARGPVDEVLAANNLTRRIAVTTPHFMTPPTLVARTDYICTTAKTIAHHAAQMLPLRVLRPPFKIPGFGFYIVWHNRFRNDPAHTFLREAVRAAIRKVAPRD